ncbi:serine dehydratase-like [Orbicella faveolata]|uniref:serine dehydratase-like n=1 Tax=Orbicella faveolata TaxID=48498 RepID=UPI0009E31BA4|nr:serine dehydratase-like [Orbicella faveolata]
MTEPFFPPLHPQSHPGTMSRPVTPGFGAHNTLKCLWYKHCSDKIMEPLHITTPLIESHALSKLTGFPVYLKLENVQPVGSFKIRGVGNLCQKAMKRGCDHMVCSSGGNAGLAAAYSARKLNIPCTIVVPGTTPMFIVERLREERATVEVCGKSWDDADARTRSLAEQPEKNGHCNSKMSCHSAKQLPEKPGMVVVSVGGGGLLSGVLQGMHDVGWTDVPLVAMETKGAHSFDAAIQAGELVTLDAITSIATCLGARTVAAKALEWTKNHKVINHVCSDEEAVLACERFADDHRMLVEPACGAALACVYERLFKAWQEQGKLGELKSTLVIVCGGNLVSMKAMKEWKDKLGSTTDITFKKIMAVNANVKAQKVQKEQKPFPIGPTP